MDHTPRADVGLRAQHHPHLVFVADMPFYRLYAPVTPPYPTNECPFIDKHNATCCPARV
jgi:hypothetical protein